MSSPANSWCVWRHFGLLPWVLVVRRLGWVAGMGVVLLLWLLFWLVLVLGLSWYLGLVPLAGLRLGAVSGFELGFGLGLGFGSGQAFGLLLRLALG
jgi:hypothetical protein